MQQYIDSLEAKLDGKSSEAKELESVRAMCYSKVKFIQDTTKADKDGDEKLIIKDQINEIMAELSNVSELSDKTDIRSIKSKSLEINLLMSQIVCEVQKLFEKSIMFEKQKYSEDLKKCSEKYDKQKLELKNQQVIITQRMQQYNEMKDKADRLQKTINDYMEQNQELSIKFDELQQTLLDERLVKDEIQQELERYKVYLPEAEGLLQEVNQRHKGAYEEIKLL